MRPEYNKLIMADSMLAAAALIVLFVWGWQAAVCIVFSAFVLSGVFASEICRRETQASSLSDEIYRILYGEEHWNLDEYSEGELAILQDKVRKLVIRLREQADQLQKEKNFQAEMMADISHQLKTPLTSILVMLDNIIEDSNMEEKIRNDFIVDIKRNVLNINFLVQSLLKLSKFDSNTVHFVKQENDLKTIVEESIKNVSTLCDLRNINVKLNIKENSKIICDDKWQIEALTNIIKNAIEHSKNNSNIIINIENNNVYSMIEVIDFGESIAKKDIKHIFERFYRCKNTKTDSIGIGLALAKTIIEEDKGTISVESNKLETKFIIKYYKI